MNVARSLLLVSCTAGLLSCGQAASPTGAGDTATDGSPTLPVGATDLGTTRNDGGTAYVPPRQPPALKAYSSGSCPVIKGGPDLATSINVNFKSGGNTRAFNLLIPPDYDGSTAYPLLFGWHWLGSSTSSMIDQVDLIKATQEEHFIAVLPDHLKKADGSSKVYELEWPFAETWGVPSELTFFDDMLTCISQQYNIDHKQVWGFGASAGALWLTYLSTTDRGNYLASEISVSGGLGNEVNVWKMQYVPQPNKFPAMVIWGGPNDWFIIDFEQSSEAYRDALLSDHHFVATCVHTLGHAVPPFTPPAGKTTFYALWQFLEMHPYGTPLATDPYKNGLPSFFSMSSSPMTCLIPPAP